jgi:hypothetical protein
MLKNTMNRLLVAAACLAAVSAVGCVSEKATPAAVVRDSVFLGYSIPDTKQTTCGNCHADVQGTWVKTKHANAWADLQASGHADTSCNKCHTTNGATNLGPDNGGFFSATSDAAKKLYQDVQCEACHGPGANHMSAPGETQPITTIQIDTTHGNGCAACHYDTHNPFTEQLAASVHGRAPDWEGAAGSCQVNCHTVWGAIPAFAPRAAYLEQGTNPLTTTLKPGFTCALCHDPHDATNAGQLRLSLSATDSAQHACGKCHSRPPVTQASSWTSSRGAHGDQFEVLQGNAGYMDPALGNIQGPARHGTQDGSCATCHMATGPVNTAAGAFAVQNTGHTFEVAPCLNPTMLSTGGVDTSAACTEANRDFSACATSNCHGDQASARSAMDKLQAEIKGYASVLWVDKNGNNSIDPFPTDSGWLPKLLQHDATRAAGTKRFGTTGADAGFTVAKGARYNVQTFASPNRHGDGSFGVHNPEFVRLILQGAVTSVRAAYAATDTLQGVPPAIEALLERAARTRSH